tara:strand:- start:40 stop:369 length:330 start_codon:yes stop_codon:yes gene_type:complete
MEENEDEFFCGETIEETIILTEKVVDYLDYNADYGHSAAIIAETKKLKEKVSDVDFVRIWEQSPNMWNVLISLEEPLRQVITGVPLIIAIHNRAINLRSKGVRLQKFTI